MASLGPKRTTKELSYSLIISAESKCSMHIQILGGAMHSTPHFNPNCGCCIPSQFLFSILSDYNLLLHAQNFLIRLVYYLGVFGKKNCKCWSTICKCLCIIKMFEFIFRGQKYPHIISAKVAQQLQCKLQIMVSVNILLKIQPIAYSIMARRMRACLSSLHLSFIQTCNEPHQYKSVDEPGVGGLKHFHICTCWGCVFAYMHLTTCIQAPPLRQQYMCSRQIQPYIYKMQAMSSFPHRPALAGCGSGQP